MKRTWEQEKAYRARRAAVLGEELEAAIRDLDKDRFQRAFTTAINYMNKPERSSYYRRFLEQLVGRRKDDKE